ncbi:MAG: type I methionyl aminopeptidase [Bacteroidales bacterium]|nr:type I methionyl aminopeptidase [Bacteroidales bacterium]
MLRIKTEEEIEVLRHNNLLVSKTLAEVAKLLKPGVSTLELDKRAEEYIRDNDAVPGFKGYHGFPNTLCTSVNSQVVHGIPSSYQLKEGDIVSVDCGVKKDGYYGDTAFTFEVGEVDPKVKQLLKVTREALWEGVINAIVGKRLGDIGYSVQKHAEDNGFSVVREMVGHGLGSNLHEAPEVPNYGKRGKGPKLPDGLVLCIEPMINMGSKEILQDRDGWTIGTLDKMPSAHFEFAVVIRKGKADVLSTFDYIDQVISNINS